jgi:predicted Rossmann fold nucleotide-binding protein DprA/Smf involved in DNA uptake
VLAGLRAGAVDADGLARATGLPASEVAAALVELELAGLVSGADGLFRATL